MNNILIIGAGVVGISIAYELSKIKKNNIYIIEKNRNIGLENSSRNSEVIHSGVYYKRNSLKNKFCIEGKKLIYKFCKKHKIKYKKIGKIFVAQNKGEENYLKKIKSNAFFNKVRDVKILSKKDIRRIEPNLICSKGLISPSSGIFDSNKFIKTLYKLCKKKGVKFIFNVKSVRFKKKKKKFQINTNNLSFDFIINCAGMNSISIAKKVFPNNFFPKDNFVKGVYFKTKQKLGLNKIIYKSMIPGVVKERIDITPTIDGNYIFGPNVQIRKRINKKKLKIAFFNEIIKYLPNLKFNEIYYYKVGYRPKIYTNTKKNNEDFYIKKMAKYNWINLFGIESPGLTSCLSIAKFVKKLIKI